MASILKVDTITGVATAGSIAVTGEGNSTTTNLQQGLAKAWVSHQHADTVDDSFNNSSIGDSGTGDFIFNFTSNMANTKYIVPNCGATYDGSTRGAVSFGMNHANGDTDQRATDHCDVMSMANANASSHAVAVDYDWTMHIFFGDLA